MHSNIHLLIIGLVVGLGISLAACITYIHLSRKRTRAEGFAAGSAARQHQIDELTNLNNQQAQEISALYGLRDAEKKHHVKALARAISSTPSDHEMLWVKRAITQLAVAAKTHHFLGNEQADRDATAVREHLAALIARIQPPAPGANEPEATAPASVIVHGPEACGKTRNAEAIAQALGLSKIVDDWHRDAPLDALDTLYLTNDRAPFDTWPNALTYDEAMQRVAKQGAAA